jgi:hypothetical protein
MATYRIFMLGSDDHIIRADIVDCSTDDEAMTLAPGFGGTHKAVEVWELARRVGRVELLHHSEAEQACLINYSLHQDSRDRSAPSPLSHNEPPVRAKPSAPADRLPSRSDADIALPSLAAYAG